MNYTNVAFPCMRVGRWDSSQRPDWTEHDLHQLCRNFRRKEFTSVLKMGHDCIPLSEMPADGQPAVGRIRRVWVEGTGRDAVMWAEADRVPVKLAEAIRAGHYSSASIEVRDLPLAAPLDEGTQLLGVALLGAASAAVDLPDLAEIAKMSTGRTHPAAQGPAMPPATLAEREPIELREMRAHVERLTREVDRVAAHTAQLLTASEQRDPRDLDALKARLGELTRAVGEVEAQRAPRPYDATRALPGAGATLQHASTTPDAADGHSHNAVVDEAGNGETDEAGTPAHRHRVVQGQVEPATLGNGQSSQHNGPLLQPQPRTAKPSKNRPLGEAGAPGLYPSGVTLPMSEDYAARSRRLVREAEEQNAMPLYRPADRVLAAELGDDVEAGERARFDRLVAVADKYKLDLRTTKGMADAKRIMFRELANTVESAKCFDEAVAAVLRDSAIPFAQEPFSRQVAARVVARVRKDLVSDYGKSERAAERRDLAQGEWSQVPAYEDRSMPAGDERLDPAAADDQRVAAFARLVRSECERLHLLAGVDDEAIHELKRRLLKAHPALAPRYRSRPPVEVKD